MNGSICTELLCPANTDKGDCSRNLGNFLGLSTYIIWALHGSPALHVSFFSPKTMKYIWKYICGKPEKNPTHFNIDCPKDPLIQQQPPPFLYSFSCPGCFFRKGWCGCGSQSWRRIMQSWGNRRAGDGEEETSPACVTSGFRAGVPPSEQRMLWTNLCCGTADAGMPAGTATLCRQGLRLKPKSYFLSAVDGAVTAKQMVPDLPAGIPGESSLQAQQLPEAAICCDTVSSKSPSPAPALPGTISPSSCKQN